MPYNDYIGISFMDSRGKIIDGISNLYLKKGLHSLIFEISLFANDVYFVNFKNSFTTKNLIFIKN